MNGLLHVSSSPHARSKVTTDKIMFAVLLALAPAACVGIWNFGLRALLLIVISMAVCPLTEYLYEKGMKKPVTIADGSALVTGLLLAMNMPVQAPLWMPVIGGVFAIFVVKQLFGGHGFDINFLGAHLLGGGLMLGAWFMATDYVTRPITKKGQYIYAVILGLLTGVFRIFGNSAEGVSYAIIFTNLLVPLIERVTVPVGFGRGGKKKA